MLHTKSTNYDRFFCIAGDCPESCCTGWQIMIDEDSLERYRDIVEQKAIGIGEELRDIGLEADYPLSAQDAPELVSEAGDAEKKELRTYLHEVLETSVDWEEGCFKHENGRCVLMTESGLCTLQRAFGEGALCKTCARYPRHMEEFDGVREWSLSLSCPEAARLILSQKETLKFMEWETEEEDDPEDYEDFEYLFYDKLVAAREAVYAVVQDREIGFRVKALALAAFGTQMQDLVDYGDLAGMDEAIAALPELVEEIAAHAAAARIAERAETNAEEIEGDPLEKELFSKMFELEILRDGWLDVVDRTWKNWDSGLELNNEQEIQAEQLLMFWIYSYFCGAVYDGMVYSKLMLAICSTWWIFQINAAHAFAGGLVESAYKFAREIEHSDENLNALEEWFDHG